MNDKLVNAIATVTPEKQAEFEAAYQRAREGIGKYLSELSDAMLALDALAEQALKSSLAGRKVEAIRLFQEVCDIEYHWFGEAEYFGRELEHLPGVWPAIDPLVEAWAESQTLELAWDRSTIDTPMRGWVRGDGHRCIESPSSVITDSSPEFSGLWCVS